MRNKKRIGIALIIAAIMLSISGCSKSAEEAPELLEPASVGISTVKVERRDFYYADLINVTVTPETAELYFTMDGEVETVRVNSGDLVQEGQVLATIDQSELLERIKEAQEEAAYIESSYAYELRQLDLGVQIAQLQYEKLQQDYTRQQAAKTDQGRARITDESSAAAEESREEESSGEESSQPEESSSAEESSAGDSGENSGEESSNEESSAGTEESSDISQQPVVPEEPGSSITEYDLQQARLNIQQAQLAYTQKQEEYGQKQQQQQKQIRTLLDKVGEDTLKAPFSGRVVALRCNEGERVNEYKTVIILANENKMQLRGDKYSNSSLRSADKLDVVIDNEVYEVTYIPYDDEYYYQAALNKQVLPSRFAFKTGTSAEFSQSGTVRMYRQYSENALVVPKACVQSDEMGSFVYQAKDGQRVKTYITIGIATSTHIEIVDGLNEGDEIYGRE